jgi:alpha-L-rhamnosidase
MKMQFLSKYPALVGLLASGMIALDSTWATDDAGAWTRIAQFLVLEPKTNAWQAQWVDAGPGIATEDFGRVFYLRKTFTAKDPQSFRRVYLSADSRYKLWVNGIPAGRGPARFDPLHQQYDTLDLSSLVHPGTNLIAAEIIYWGPGEPSRGGPIFQMSARPAFVFESAEVKTDRTWKSLISAGQKAPPWECVSKGAGYFAGNWLEQIDARLVPVGWEEPGFDDAGWANARLITRAEKWGEGDTRAPWKLLPRAIPAQEERAPEAAQPLQTGLVKDTQAMPPFSFEVEPASETPTLPYRVPGDGKIHYLVFSAGKLVTAFPRLEMEGGEGAVVEVMYAEAPSLKFQKDRRDQLGNKRVEGYNDIYITRSGRQVFEPFFHRTFWYVRVAVKTDQPLTIHGLNYRWTSYGFPERGKFECSDATLNQIWKTGWYTARLCAHESYEDCPYYEQLQYVGDTRIQALVTYYASGDSRLPATAIRHLNASRLPEGLTYSRYPSHLYQIIPGFSLFWVLMLDDYYLYTGDTNLVRECAGGIYSVLRFFEKYQTAQGFIGNLPYWNFHDWNFRPNGEPPGSKENCTLTTLLYKGALDAGSRLFDALGDRHEAERFRERAQTVARIINEKAWSESDGLYWDGIEAKTLSRHVNIDAVLFGVADATRQARIAQRLFTDKSVRDVTFYFAYYLHQAADLLGQPQRLVDDMARWKSMLDMGTSTWWETAGNTRSDCHAWSAAPTAVLMREILGVRPTAPGFARVEIRPFPAKLEWARGTVPTPHGDLSVSWQSRPVFALRTTVPEGVLATVVLPSGKRQEIGPGAHTIQDAR